MLTFITLVLFYFIGVFTTFFHIMKENKDLYFLCSYKELKEELLMDFLTSLQSWLYFRNMSFKFITNVCKSFVKFIVALVLDPSAFFSKYTFCVWAMRNYSTSNVFFVFLVDILLKLYFEYSNEISIYNTFAESLL